GVGAAQPNNVVIDNVHAIKNSFGIAAAKGNSIAINRSVVTGNSTAGLVADQGARITVDSSVVSHNATGVSAGGSVALANTDVVFNSTGISGATTTFGTNRIFGNGSAPTAAGPPASALGQQ